jgi:outer membrane receptor protein involved in Fe transport
LTDCALYGTPSLCSLIHRQNSGSLWTGDGTLAGTGYIATTLQNIGEQRTKGFDFAANYRVPMSALHLSNFGRVDFNFVGTLLTRFYTLPIAGAPGGYDCVGLYGPQCGTPNPAWRHKLRVTWSTPWKVDASVQWRYIGSNNLDPLGQAALGSNFGQYSYLDLAFTYKVTGNIELHGGVNNVLDIDPPLFITSNETGTANVGVGPGNGNTIPSVYDSMGRTIFLGLTGKF